MGDDFLYDRAGVDTRRAGAVLGRLASSINETLSLRDGSPFGRPILDLGFYANILALGDGRGLAIATDGVGTKIIVAEMAGRYDTIGIDLIAMNVNDIICVGAEPFAMVDYIAVGTPDDRMFEELGRGLLEGSRRSGITIPGGEIAQVKELIRGHGACDGLDLVGTAVGLVDLDRVILGQAVKPGDVVIGLEANGLHSNGFTLARRVLLDDGGMALDATPPGFEHTLADELLRPTRLYVKAVLALLEAGLPVHALAHITGDGFCNLERVRAEASFVLDTIPEPGGVYRLLQETGGISDAEMFSVFNMGIGFCVVLPPEAAADALAICAEHDTPGSVIGNAREKGDHGVTLPQWNLVGDGGRFTTNAAGER